MNRILFIFLLCFVIGKQGVAQQEVQFTQFMYNKLFLNPAYAGVRGIPSIKAIYRRQWQGFDGAPESKLISFDAPMFKDKVGFGFTFIGYKQGVTSNWQTSMAYSYKLKLQDDLFLRLGLQGSVRYYGINFNDPEMIILQRDDPSILENMEAQNYYGNFGVGTYLLYKQFYVGISIPNFYNNEIGFNTETTGTIAKEVKHYYLMTGILIPLNSAFQLRPAFLVKYVKNAPLDIESNLTLIYGSEVSVGISYRAGGDRIGESIDLMALYQMNKVAFGFAYDFTLSPLSKHTAGSFEALVRYDFVSERTDMANPRFFY